MGPDGTHILSRWADLIRRGSSLGRVCIPPSPLPARAKFGVTGVARGLRDREVENKMGKAEVSLENKGGGIEAIPESEQMDVEEITHYLSYYYNHCIIVRVSPDNRLIYVYCNTAV